MGLTSFQKKALNRYREYRTEEINVGSIMIPTIPRLIVLLILAIASYFLVDKWFGYFMFGVMMGAFLRQLSMARTASRVTPILLQVIDWKAVDDLLADHE